MKTPKKKATKEKPQKEKIEGKFAIEQIEMNKGLQWKIKMKVSKILPKSYHDYTIKMTLDEEIYKIRIASYEQEQKELGRGQIMLLPEMIEARKGELHDKIVDERKALEEMRGKCKKIEFVAEVRELKYKDGDTIINLRIPDDIVQPLNEQKFLFAHYKIELIPIEL
jgi:hypothetical protein